MPESAFIIQVPEAELLVGDLRAQFDSSAKLGVPAHITVLYPFLPPESVTEAILQSARAAISEIQPFEFRLAKVGRFPGVLYLAPEPSGPFVEMTERLTRQFPDFPPYAGKFPLLVPHLTVADGGESQTAAAEAQLLTVMKQHGPVPVRCDTVTLIENSLGRWRERCSIPLGGASDLSVFTNG